MSQYSISYGLNSSHPNAHLTPSGSTQYISSVLPNGHGPNDNSMETYNQLMHAYDMIHVLNDKVKTLEETGSRASYDVHEVVYMRGKIDGLNGKLKEANNRIRYLVDENDKLIGRINEYKNPDLDALKRHHQEREEQLMRIIEQQENTIKLLTHNHSLNGFQKDSRIEGQNKDPEFNLESESSINENDYEDTTRKTSD